MYRLTSCCLSLPRFVHGDLAVKDNVLTSLDPYETDETCNPELYSLRNILATGDPSLLKSVNCALLSPCEADIINVSNQLNKD